MYPQSNPLFYALHAIIGIYIFLLIIHVVLSWLLAFDIINRNSHFVQQVEYALKRLFEPALKRIRPHMPDLGGLDISVLALFLGVQILDYTLYWAEGKMAM